jgi:hypothetical protein
MPKVSVDVGYVDVDVDFSDYDTDDLIDEIESRGFEVLECNDQRLNAPVFERSEIEALVRLVEAQTPSIGSELYFLRDKLVRS